MTTRPGGRDTHPAIRRRTKDALPSKPTTEYTHAAPATRSLLSELPVELQRERVMRAAQTAEFLGLSIVHLRRLARRGAVPAPVHLSERRLGWRLGDLIDWAAQRSTSH